MIRGKVGHHAFTQICTFTHIERKIIFSIKDVHTVAFRKLLGQIGIIDAAFLREKRRYAIVIAFIAAAVLTPPDPLSQISLALPIILLYEISIWTGRAIERVGALR